MGITGLIPFLEKASRPVTLKELSNSVIAIDGFCWLHRGVAACAEKLFRGEKTDFYVYYCLKQLKTLLSHDIKPIMVFDGQSLKAKNDTDNQRRKSRAEAKEKAIELMAEGKTEDARKYMSRSVNITNDMALELIRACREIHVDCIVAPYEADGQLAYLSINGIVDYVITEDSDLVIFGCTKILFKFNIARGAILYDSKKLHLAMGVPLVKFSLEKFRAMCVLSGCDYLNSLPGIGLKKAQKFFLLTEETDFRRALGKIPSYLKMRQLVVTEEYKENFIRAITTFKHMIVFDPKSRKLTRINPIEGDIDEGLLVNSGEYFDEEKAFEMALGNINPKTGEKIDNWHPSKENIDSKSIWNHGSVREEKESSLEGLTKRIKMVNNEEISNENIDDLSESVELKTMMLYGSPPSKRRKLCDETTPDEQKHRNPFKRGENSSNHQSPKLTQSTSLLKVVSELFKKDSEAEKDEAIEKLRAKLRMKPAEICPQPVNLENLNVPFIVEQKISSNESGEIVVVEDIEDDISKSPKLPLKKLKVSKNAARGQSKLSSFGFFAKSVG